MKSESPSFVYFVPVHNEAAILAKSVEKLEAALSAYPGSEVFLLENGSSDNSSKIAKSLEGTRQGVTFRAFSTPLAGMGHAYRLGLQHLPKLDASRRVVFTAADLPFGFSDVESFLRVSPSIPLAIGSKAHPGSLVHRGVLRSLMSQTFFTARRLLLGMRTRDCQGTLFVRGDLIKEMEKARAGDFFFTTEMTYIAEKKGWDMVEMPVTYVPTSRPSTVRPFRHGKQMLRQLWNLRQNPPVV